MAFTLTSPTRRTIVALVAALVVVTLAYETRMLDSGYTAWLEMTGDDEPPAAGSHLAFDATAYCKGTTTAAGVNVRRGIAAADPQLLPVGTVVTLATGDPEYNGVYTIMDTGPKVQGRHLDLYVWSCNEALQFGRRRVGVTVLRLGWDPRASSPSLIDRLFRGREVRRRSAESKAEGAPAPEPTVAPEATLAEEGADGALSTGEGEAAGEPAVEAAPSAPPVPVEARPAPAAPQPLPRPGPPPPTPVR